MPTVYQALIQSLNQQRDKNYADDLQRQPLALLQVAGKGPAPGSVP